MTGHSLCLGDTRWRKENLEAKGHVWCWIFSIERAHSWEDYELKHDLLFWKGWRSDRNLMEFLSFVMPNTIVTSLVSGPKRAKQQPGGLHGEISQAWHNWIQFVSSTCQGASCGPSMACWGAWFLQMDSPIPSFTSNSRPASSAAVAAFLSMWLVNLCQKANCHRIWLIFFVFFSVLFQHLPSCEWRCSSQLYRKNSSILQSYVKMTPTFLPLPCRVGPCGQ